MRSADVARPLNPGVDPPPRFLEDLAHEVQRAALFQRNTALILLQADSGEEPSGWVPWLRGRLRPIDRIGRYRDGMLGLSIIEADGEAALRLAEALLAAPPSGASAFYFGVASYPESGTCAEQLLDAAVDALRRATPYAPVQRARGLRPSENGKDPGEPSWAAVVRSPTMVELYRTAGRIARSRLPVLITGETGTGKEILARQIHAQSGRGDGPLQCINCGALPDSLVESTLFGHEKGAFTGAVRRQEGLFEAARGGSLLLDEIGEMPLSAQVALLRVLETQEFRRVGGHEVLRADVRVLAATHRDLDREVAVGKFREDLLYRINVMTLWVPPLRERVEEIGPLAERFAREAVPDGQPAPQLTPDTLDRLRSYSWPGNVRELRNVVQRAVVIARGPTLNPDDLPARVLSPSLRFTPLVSPRITEQVISTTQRPSFRQAIRACESVLIRDALRRTDGNHAAAARHLGMPRRTLSYKVRNFGLTPEQPDPPAHLSLLERLLPPQAASMPFRERIRQIEAQLLRAAMQRNHDDPSAAARDLRLHPSTFAAKWEQLDG